MTEVIDVTGEGRDVGVARAAEVLRDGQLVVLPTDTVYGLAADAFDLDGTARIAEVKERARQVPLPVLVRSPKQLVGLTTAIPAEAERLMAAFWPGPLTLVLPAEPGLVWDLGRTQGTVAVRMPLDDVALEVIRAVGPLAVTGAGRVGEPPAETAAAAEEAFGDRVAIYLDDGPRRGREPSTIVDLTRGAPHLLRDGVIGRELILAVASGQIDPIEAGSPGTAAEDAGDDADADGADVPADVETAERPGDAGDAEG